MWADLDTVAGVSAPRGVSTLLTATVLLLSGLLFGCTDDEEPTPAPSPTATETTATPTDEVSPTPDEPTVTAATGLQLQEETSQLNLPEGPWTPIDDVVSYSSAAGLDGTSQVIALSDRENFATPATLDDQVRFLEKALPKGTVVERQPDVVLDGEPAYSVQWSEKGDTVLQHDIGTNRGGRVIHVHFDLDKDDPTAADALVDSVLASFAWR